MYQIFDVDAMVAVEFDSLIDALGYIVTHRIVSAVMRNDTVVITCDEIEWMLNN
jgi:hypothetical protein